MAIPVLAGVVMKIAAPLIAQKLAGKVSKREADDIAAQTVQEIVTQVTADPQIKNDLNAEPLWQSRTANGSVVAFVGALVIVIQKFQAREFDEVFGLALATVVGSSYAFLGRALNWSAPMWSRVGRWFSRK